MAETECRYFNGYKPCVKNPVCSMQCHSYSPVDSAILVIHLGAMGSVVRSTALLRKIKDAHPNSYVVWVTEKPSHEILKFHPAIDRIFELNFDSTLSLQAFKFDTVYALDKDIRTAGLLKTLSFRQVKGFSADPHNGGISPADIDADELWSLGLSNEKKFFENKKPEIQLLFETCGLEYSKDKYWLHLNFEETAEAQRRGRLWSEDGRKLLIGINTGCGNVITYKKMSLKSQMELIKRITDLLPDAKIVLLGGKDETELNAAMAAQWPQVVLSDTRGGVRDGLQSIAAVDCLISGDSFAMHAGIALNKFTLAWFGPTCAHEVEFYENGFAIKSELACSPCWKRDCSNQILCYDHPDIGQFIMHLQAWARPYIVSKQKQPLEL